MHIDKSKPNWETTTQKQPMRKLPSHFKIYFLFCLSVIGESEHFAVAWRHFCLSHLPPILLDCESFIDRLASAETSGSYINHWSPFGMGYHSGLTSMALGCTNWSSGAWHLNLRWWGAVRNSRQQAKKTWSMQPVLNCCPQTRELHDQKVRVPM